MTRSQEKYNETNTKTSTRCSKEALTFVIVLTTQIKYKLNSIVIKTISLHREEINREIFVMPPKETVDNV